MRLANLPARFTWLDRCLVLVLLGYMLTGRSFAHLGVAPLYVGEMTLATYLLLRPQAAFGPALGALTRPSPGSGIAWCTYVSLVFGLVATVRGWAAEHSPLVTLQCFAFHIYPLFVWIGIEVGRRHPDFFARLALPLAYLSALYGAAYVLVLSPLGLTDTVGNHTFSVFGAPTSSELAILFVLTHGGSLRRAALPLALNGFVMLAMQVRASWLGLLACLPVWAGLTGRLGQVVKIGVALVLVLALAWGLDVKLESPARRHGGELSVRALGTKVLAIFDPDEAERVSPNIDSRADTIDWRTSWWKEIWTMVHSQPLYALVGPGYGYPIWDLHPYGTEDFPLRTPHNSIVYVLAYTGWLGVALFLLFQFSLLAALVGAYRRNHDPMGLCVWIWCNVRALFDNVLESPQFAIVCYTLMGVALAASYSPVRVGAASAEGNACPFQDQ